MPGRLPHAVALEWNQALQLVICDDIGASSAPCTCRDKPQSGLRRPRPPRCRRIDGRTIPRCGVVHPGCDHRVWHECMAAAGLLDESARCSTCTPWPAARQARHHHAWRPSLLGWNPAVRVAELDAQVVRVQVAAPAYSPVAWHPGSGPPIRNRAVPARLPPACEVRCGGDARAVQPGRCPRACGPCPTAAPCQPKPVLRALFIASQPSSATVFGFVCRPSAPAGTVRPA
jgi:hypothetical protein